MIVVVAVNLIVGFPTDRNIARRRAHAGSSVSGRVIFHVGRSDENDLTWIVRIVGNTLSIVLFGLAAVFKLSGY